MSIYKVLEGTRGKILTRIQFDEYNIKDWVTRKDLTFAESACGINPDMLHDEPDAFNKDSLGVSLAKDGYAIFTNNLIFDAESKYVLAIPFNKVNKT